MKRLQRQIIAALRSQLTGGSAKPPVAGVQLWNVFGQLSGQRTWHAHGPNPISFADLEAFCRLMRLPLEPAHIRIILAMDRVWLEHGLAKLRTGKDAPRQVSKAPMTVALFDALWG